MSKSPLRYPGGKSRAISQILPLIPDDIRQYREPFIGGGSVLLAVRDKLGSAIDYTINDINPDLIAFWRTVQQNADALADAVLALRTQYIHDGRALYYFLKNDYALTTDFERAVRFFVLNRITFSGVAESGGYSAQAFDKRFTLSSVERLRKVAPSLAGVTITNTDYQTLLFQSGEGVFIFLDPPYWSATESRLYGKNGLLHTTFDHERFADNMRRCSHRWLITYDDSPYIRELFSFANVIEWELQYGMNNFKQSTAAKGKELFIANY